MYGVGRVEDARDGTVLAQSAPTRFGDGWQGSLDFAHGPQRVLVVELRDTEDLSGPVRYYGRSEVFDAKRGDVIELVVALRWRRPPGDDAALEAVVGPSGYVPQPTVELRLFGDRATHVALSDTDDFSAGRTRTLELATLPGDPGRPDARIAEWTLDEFNPCPAQGRCVRRVHGQFIDAEGYRSLTRSSGDITIDSEPPEVVERTVDVLLLPRAGNLQGSLLAVGALTDLRVSFSVSEALATTPTVAIDGTEIRLQRIAGSLATFSYQLRGDAFSAEGDRQLTVTMVDRAGNTATQRLGETVRLDQTAPAAPATAPGAMVLRRAPHGAARSGGEVEVSVVAAPGTTEPGALVRFFSEPDVTAASALGQVQADPGGGFTARLFERDRPAVYAVVVDDAGNASDDDLSLPGVQATPILDSEWTASLGEPASAPANPHEFDVHVATGRGLPSGGLPFTEAGRRAVSEPGGTPAIFTSNRVWQALRRSDYIPPSTRTDAVAYDARRDRVVLVRGSRAESRTYELDGDRWIDKTPGFSPPPRGDAAMAYDGKQGRVILFGGRGADGLYLNDTWAWDGERWEELEPPGLIFLMGGHAMAHDEGRGRVVLFGGGRIQVLDAFLYTNTFEWDGEDWSRLEFPNGPPGRLWPALAYDPSGGGILVFGGCGQITSRECTQALDDTWRYTGFGWQEVTTATRPPASHGGKLVHDPGSGDMLLLLGVTDGGSTGQQVWRFDGVDWSRAPDAPFSARSHAHAVARTARGEALFGAGCSQGLFRSGQCQGALSPNDDYWRLADGAWQAVRTSTAWPSEPVRAAWDPAGSGAWVLTQEDDVHGVFGWDGQSWSRPDSGSALRPPARIDAIFAPDPIGGGALLSGGRAPGGSDLQDIWRFSGGRWSVITSSAAVLPGPRQNGVVSMPQGITVPGLDPGDPPGGWRWDGAAWRVVPLPLGQAPLNRKDAGLAYDSAAQRLLLFGGYSTDESTGISTIHSETWIWDSTGWNEFYVGPGYRPRPRFPGVFAYDVGAARAVMYGGGSPGYAYDDTWTFDGTDLTRLFDGPDRPPSAAGPTYYDEAQEAVTIVRDDALWSFAPPPPDQRPGYLFTAHFGAAGLSEIGVGEIEVTVEAGGIGADAAGAPLPGAEVLVWDARGSEWVSAGSNSAPEYAPAELVATSGLGPRAIAELEGVIYVLLRSRGATGPDEAETIVSHSFMEITVRHRQR